LYEFLKVKDFSFHKGAEDGKEEGMRIFKDA
jgi:hypothetical protein